MAFIKIRGNILNLVQIRTIIRDWRADVEGVEITYTDGTKDFFNVTIEEVEQAIQEI